ncbi:hypothetical protein GMMP15_660055 [Candidatus Magnetomoraceae bacterium gMMP-15]
MNVKRFWLKEQEQLHYRNTGDLPLYVADVELELETRGQAHIDKIVKELENSEYKYKIL